MNNIPPYLKSKLQWLANQINSAIPELKPQWKREWARIEHYVGRKISPSEVLI